MYNNCMVYRADAKLPRVTTALLKILVALLPIICSRPAFSQQTVGEKVFKSASPSVVTVQSGESTGTAFLVRDKNTFVTAAHVIEDGAIPVIRYGKGSFLAVRAITYSKALDLAILETEDPFPAKPLALGDKEKLSPGASVFAIGTALGALTNTLTDGMISNGRKAGNVNLVQVSSPFSPGMSGGPVLSKDSKVIGVISFSFTDGQNLNMAVAAKHVRELLSVKARSTAVVCNELRDRKSPAGSDASSPIPSAETRVERELALAYAVSEVQSIVWAALDECERITGDPTTNTDTGMVERAISRLQKKLPLITTEGRENESSLTARLTKYCTAKELEMLAEIVLSIARALDEMAIRYKASILEWDREGASTAEKVQMMVRAKDSWSRVFALKEDFLDLAETIHGSSRLWSQVSPKYHAFSARYLNIYPDYDRPNLAAVIIDKNPVLETNFRDGDVINGIRRAGSESSFTEVKTWKDVYLFFLKERGKTIVEVRLQSGRIFHVTVYK